MKTTKALTVFLACGLCSMLPSRAQGTAFTYQGRLNSNGSPANGAYDLVLALYNDPVSGSQQGVTLTNSAVAVSNGLFTTTVDFGSAPFNGQALWLQMLVRSNGVGAFAPLSPRQALSATPYAVTAQGVSGPVNAAQVTGTLANSTLPANLNVSGTITAGGFAGSGAGLTGLNANNLSSGTVALAQLPGSVLTNGAGGVSLAGSFTGNGAGITNVSLNSVSVTQFANRLVAWGTNDSGQASPPLGLSNVVAAAAGSASSVGLRSDGTVVAWGNGLYGQTNVPAGLSNVTAIAAGSAHVLALKNDGTVVGWGDNTFGQTNVAPELTNIIAIAAGAAHSMVLLKDGTVLAWGIDYDHESDVPAGLSNVVAIGAGYLHSLAVKQDGTVVCWGYNSFGQLNIPAGLSNVVAVAGGFSYSAALKADGTVVTWGDPALSVPAGLSNVVGLACAENCAVALKADGTLVFWGNNLYGEGNLPPALHRLVGVFSGPSAMHFLAVEKEPYAGVALLNTDNSFQYNMDIGGDLRVGVDINSSGNINAGGTVSGSTITGTNISGGVISAGLFSGALRLNDTNLWFRPAPDVLNGLGWYGSGRTFGSLSPDGPVLFGREGGALGTFFAGQRAVLVWNTSGVTVSGGMSVLSGLSVSSGLNVSGSLIADGSSLTNLNAAQLASGTVPASRLAGTYTNALTLNNPNNQLTASFNVASSGNLRLNDRPIYLRTGSDPNHGLAYNGYPGGVTNFGNGNVQVDGPVLWGFTGGALAVMNGGAHAVLTWTNGGVQVNGGFSYGSDRNTKTNFAALNPRQVLERLEALPVQSWTYKADPAARHVGPMAQDFHAAFECNGSDDTHINVGDEAGVALAAIQGLNQDLQAVKEQDRRLQAQLEAKEAQIRALKEENRSFAQRLEALEQRLHPAEGK